MHREKSKNIYSNLSSDERLNRIANIINKGIYLYALKNDWFDKKDQRKSEEKKITAEEEQIILLAKKAGRITNNDVQALFSWHRNTTTQRLKDMISKGLLVRTGKGRHCFYTTTKLILTK